MPRLHRVLYQAEGYLDGMLVEPKGKMMKHKDVGNHQLLNTAGLIGISSDPYERIGNHNPLRRGRI